MKVEVLFFEGCPNHALVKEMVRRILEREKMKAEVRAVEVGDVETAQTLRFLGSPSVRVNGVDIEPGRENDAPFYGCRTYTVEGKTTGVPPVEWLVAAFQGQGDEKVLPRGGKRSRNGQRDWGYDPCPPLWWMGGSPIAVPGAGPRRERSRRRG